ncbi:hypothetical protein MTO96_048287 [Rhipicephalus appendiculatus]
MISNNDFALRLLPLLSTSQLDNVFYSPYSVTTALAMVHAGADALTLRELHEALKYNLVGLAEDKVVGAHAEFNRELLGPSNSTLKVANAVVLDQKLNALSSYLDALKNGFAADLLKANFTGGQAGVPEDYQFVGEPEDAAEDYVEVLKRQLNGTAIADARYRLREARIKLHLPRFKLEEKYQLKEVLPKLGIKRMFNAGEADLSRINGEKSLFVDQVVHKAVVEVNEEGSEAAAVTGVTINTRTTTGPSEIHVDRPFLFYIGNKRIGNILFVGQVNKIA